MKLFDLFPTSSIIHLCHWELYNNNNDPENKESSPAGCFINYLPYWVKCKPAKRKT